MVQLVLKNRLLLPYSGKLSREKTFVNFVVLWLFVKFFSEKFGGVTPLALQKRAIRKNRIFHQSVKVFSLKSFPPYGIVYTPVCLCHSKPHNTTVKCQPICVILQLVYRSPINNYQQLMLLHSRNGCVH